MLAITFYQPGTGLTRVMLEIIKNLPPHYDWHWIGIGYKGPMQRHEHYTLHPCNLHGGDVFGVFASLGLIESLKPKVVFLLNDFWIIRHYIRQYVSLEKRPKIYAYIPLDGLIPKPELIAELIDLDVCVLYTKFACQEFTRNFEAISQGARKTPRLEVIAHGVDTAIFHPLCTDGTQPKTSRRLKARQRLFPENFDWQENAFIFLNANRPNPRKRIDLTIMGFTRFAKDKPPSVKLLLHHAMMQQKDREELKQMLAASDIANRVMLFPTANQPVSDHELNLIYNACDVGINTSMGEGWGLVSVEHGATGAPQIVPRHSACGEIWENYGIQVKVNQSMVPSFSDLEMGVIDTEDLVDQMNRLYYHQDIYQFYCQNAFELVRSKNYDWQKIGLLWHECFQKSL